MTVNPSKAGHPRRSCRAPANQTNTELAAGLPEMAGTVPNQLSCSQADVPG